MPKILAIDDDIIQLKLLKTALDKRGFDTVTAHEGIEGLRRARAEQPDIIILDVNMPGIDGFEVARRLRRDPATKNILILMLTALSQVSDKVEAFNIGVDDYMTKPFEIGELAARLSTLLRRFDKTNSQRDDDSAMGQFIAVHTLRGGIGCSNIALNVALSLYNIWESPTILLDNAFIAGQMALLLDTPARRTWADFSAQGGQNFDSDALFTAITKHDSGLHFLAAPTDPVEATEIDNFAVKAAISFMQPRYEYLVADLAHDFSDKTLEVLESSDRVLLVLAPDIVSVRLAANSLTVYEELGFTSPKVELILVQNVARPILTPKQIEKALRQPISHVVPYAPETVARAIGAGVPFVSSHPKDPISISLEDLAYHQSKPGHLEIPPPVPSAAWQRVQSRQHLAQDEGEKASKWLPFVGRLNNAPA